MRSLARLEGLLQGPMDREAWEEMSVSPLAFTEAGGGLWLLAPAQTQEATFSTPSLGEAWFGFLTRNNI